MPFLLSLPTCRLTFIIPATLLTQCNMWYILIWHQFPWHWSLLSFLIPLRCTYINLQISHHSPPWTLIQSNRSHNFSSSTILFPLKSTIFTPIHKINWNCVLFLKIVYPSPILIHLLNSLSVTSKVQTLSLISRMDFIKATNNIIENVKNTPCIVHHLLTEKET